MLPVVEDEKFSGTYTILESNQFGNTFIKYIGVQSPGWFDNSFSIEIAFLASSRIARFEALMHRYDEEKEFYHLEISGTGYTPKIHAFVTVQDEIFINIYQLDEIETAVNGQDAGACASLKRYAKQLNSKAGEQHIKQLQLLDIHKELYINNYHSCYLYGNPIAKLERIGDYFEPYFTGEEATGAIKAGKNTRSKEWLKHWVYDRTRPSSQQTTKN